MEVLNPPSCSKESPSADTPWDQDMQTRLLQFVLDDPLYPSFRPPSYLHFRYQLTFIKTSSWYGVPAVSTVTLTRAGPSLGWVLIGMASNERWWDHSPRAETHLDLLLKYHITFHVL